MCLQTCERNVKCVCFDSRGWTQEREKIQRETASVFNNSLKIPLTLEFELNMNETFNTSFILNQAPNFNILAVKEWHAYCLIFIYVVVIIFSSFGSILIIAAVIRTKSNIFIGQI